MRHHINENGSYRPTLLEEASDGMLLYFCSHMIYTAQSLTPTSSRLFRGRR